jgi:sulfofructosephosphate aldolase
VTTFVERCRRRGRPGIVEGIVRAQGTPDPDEHVRLVIEAGRELAGYGADLYKAEVPTLGRSDDEAVTEGARRLTDALPCPWVVLSNGTAGERFASAALAAAQGGASGFLAGRAIWLDAIAAEDMDEHLRTVAAARLRDLATAVDDVARPWWEHVAA